MKYVSKVDKINLVDLNLAFKVHIEPGVEEDDATYMLQKKSKLLRKFILYRMSSFFLDQIMIAKKDSAKLVLFLDKNLQLGFLKDHELYVKNSTKLLAQLLGICIHKSSTNLSDFTSHITGSEGESIEHRNKLKISMMKTRKNPNLQNFYNLMSKNNIYKVQDHIRGNTHLKLGLFVT